VTISPARAAASQTEDSDEATRDLAPHPPFECVPSLHFATRDQAKAGAETNYYESQGDAGGRVPARGADQHPAGREVARSATAVNIVQLRDPLFGSPVHSDLSCTAYILVNMQ
jgi:hypothetical protein